VTCPQAWLRHLSAIQGFRSFAAPFRLPGKTSYYILRSRRAESKGRFRSSRCFGSTHRARVLYTRPGNTRSRSLDGASRKVPCSGSWESGSGGRAAPLEGEILSSIYFFFPYRSVWLRCGTGFFIYSPQGIGYDICPRRDAMTRHTDTSSASSTARSIRLMLCCRPKSRPPGLPMQNPRS
jgi:hypothetical protein